MRGPANRGPRKIPMNVAESHSAHASSARTRRARTPAGTRQIPRTINNLNGIKLL